MQSHKAYFGTLFVIGLFLAISLQTGYDISQEGIAILILQAFQSAFPIEDQFFSFIFEIVILFFIVIGIISPFIIGFSAYEEGPTYLIISIIGFATGISLLFIPFLFVVLLVLGVFATKYLDS